MRIAFISDYSSSIARGWISGVAAMVEEVHVLSTVRWDGPIDPAVASVRDVSIALDAPLRKQRRSAVQQPDHLRSYRRWDALSALRRRSAPHWVRLMRRAAARNLDEIQPDVVHALRVPIEGGLASLAVSSDTPLVVSSWGNDFTLSARTSRSHGRLARRVMQRADGFIADCERDRHLGIEWGFSEGSPAATLPTGGGIDLDVFRPAEPVDARGEDAEPTFFNPRGLRHYVAIESFFRALPIVLREAPAARFACVGTQGNPHIARLVDDLGVAGCVDLLPLVAPEEMAEHFRSATACVSLTTHDGTPNTLLEAMASGCFPIVGRLDSVGEWLADGETALFCDPLDPDDVASAMLKVLNSAELRQRASSLNRRLVSDVASRDHVMEEALRFYETVLASNPSR